MSLSVASTADSLRAQQPPATKSSGVSSGRTALTTSNTISPATERLAQQNAARLSGLQNSLHTSNHAVGVAHTAGGALGQIKDLLSQIRGLAVEGANTLDPAALKANSAQAANALEAMNSIASNAKYGDRNLLDGSLDINARQDPSADQLRLGSAEFAIGSALTQDLGKGAVPGTDNLDQIDLSTNQGAATALKVIDKAIKDVTRMQDQVSAFQDNTVWATNSDLLKRLQISPDSLIRDSKLATDTANDAKGQIQQIGLTGALQTANHTSSLILSLLQGPRTEPP